MNLELVKGKHTTEQNETVTIYENNYYKVFLVETEDSVKVNFLRKEFKYPSIDEYRGTITVNVPASGDLSIKNLGEFISLLGAAKSTAEQARELQENYVF